MVDMWAFGCTFYEVSHLKPMFSGSFLVVINNIANVELSPFDADFPENFKQAIMQCFEKRPDDRLNVLDFIDIVENIKYSLGKNKLKDK